MTTYRFAAATACALMLSACSGTGSNLAPAAWNDPSAGDCTAMPTAEQMSDCQARFAQLARHPEGLEETYGGSSDEAPRPMASYAAVPARPQMFVPEYPFPSYERLSTLDLDTRARRTNTDSGGP